MASHDFDHHDAFVTRGSRVQPVEGISDHGHGRIESEGHGGCFQVVVDGFGNADAIDAGLL